METHARFRARSWSSALGWCTTKDVLIAFSAVNREIRAKYQRLDVETLTLAEACQLARRIKDQRDLIHQLSDRRSWKHVRLLVRLNARQRDKLIELARQAGLNTGVLVFK